MVMLWDSVLGQLKKKVNAHVFDTWFKPTEQFSYEKGVLTIAVPNRFFKEWLNSGEYKNIIDSTIQEITDNRPLIHYKVCKEKEEGGNDVPVGVPVIGGNNKKKGWPHKLNQTYTFERFVVGACNQFSHAASLAVSETPGKAYNPFFIYGGVGLGKTHLMHAIGHFVLRKTPSLKLLYLTSEFFVNDLIGSLQRDKMENFRNKYRSIDVLLIDDIQFIAGKDRTQEEFFHTFNALYEDRKQIVISSDQIPKDISGLEERLRSRFEWGLIADIQPPDLETKLAILQSKSESLGYSIPTDVSYYIASKVKSNIRELEGSLLRLSAMSDLTGSAITLEMAKKSLHDVLRIDNRPPNIEKIQKVVCEHFRISLSDIKSRKRTKSITIPRQIAMYIIREYTNSSLPEIGKSFGDKDHTTVLHSCRKIKAIVKDNHHEISQSIKVISDELDL